MNFRYLFLSISLVVTCLFLFGHPKSNVIHHVTQTNNDSLNLSDTSGCIVYVSFVVNKKGKVNQTRVDSFQCNSDPELKSSLEREALRVIDALPDFEPTIKDGKPIKVKYRLPVRFVIKQDSIIHHSN